jgi:virginiamycin B lyase
MLNRIPRSVRLRSNLTAAGATLAFAAAVAAGQASAASLAAFTSRGPAGPVQTFNIAPVTSRSHGVEFGVRSDKKIAFHYFALVPPGVGAAQDIAVGRDGNLWVTTNCVGAIERLTIKGVATAYSYGNPSQCNTSTSITPGPDGNLWFVDQFANIVGKISKKGVITKYPLPAASPCNTYPSQPLGIVAGPDGAMWFTVTYPGNNVCSPSGFSAPAIGRITTHGKMTFFYTAPAGTTHTVSPERITAGPDGNLYFIASLPSNAPALAVGLITTGGSISYSAAFGTAANFNDHLTFGSDGNLWVTDVFDSEIFRIAGSQTAGFPVGAFQGIQETAYGIAIGPDKALWFTTSDDNELGAIATSGQITFHPAPSCAPDNCGGGGGIVLRGKALWYALPGDRTGQDVVEATRLP